MGRVIKGVFTSNVPPPPKAPAGSGVCPHCRRVFALRYGYIPGHRSDGTKLNAGQCPGSSQIPLQ